MSRVLSSSALVAVISLTLVGCSPSPEAPQETGSAAPPSVPDPTEVGFVPEGTAEENLPIFTQVVDQVWAGDQAVQGRAYVDALEAVGFEKLAMQVTPDLTTIGNPVESLLFSVRWGSDACLVGQVGPSTGEPVTQVMEQLDGGRCLIGETRQIDW